MTTENSKKNQCRKGIILAGGTGSRLYPLTAIVNKQLLPLYDKPIIYYPLTTLMLAGIREVLLISHRSHLKVFQQLLGDGAQWGISIKYAVQENPNGLPEAFIIGSDFIENQPVALILGDNVFHGQGFSEYVNNVAQDIQGAHLFAFGVNDPQRYGVVVIDANGKPIDIEEKPEHPKSKYAVTGLYFYDASVVDLARTLRPSKRGETEITDLNKIYMQNGEATVHKLGRGYVWFDVGTPKALYQATDYVQVVQSRQGTAIACPEEVAWRMGYISKKEFTLTMQSLPKGCYSSYLHSVLDEDDNDN